LGRDIFANQSKTVNLLQLSVPQVPLFLQPLGEPSLVEQLAQAICFYILNSLIINLLRMKVNNYFLDSHFHFDLAQ